MATEKKPRKRAEKPVTVTAQDEPAPVKKPLVTEQDVETALGPVVEEQFLSLSCRHGEVAYVRASMRPYKDGDLYFCRRCNMNRFVRGVLLSQTPFS